MTTRSRKNLLFTTLSLFSILGYGFFVFAAPPGLGGYNPGETLDPQCTPGDLLPNPCIVKLPLTTADNGLTVTGSNVQLGGVLVQDTVIDQDGFKLSTIFTDDGTAFSVPVDYFIENGGTRTIVTTGQLVPVGIFGGVSLPGYENNGGIGIREADQGPSPIMYEQTNELYKAVFFGDQETWLATYDTTDQTSGNFIARGNQAMMGFSDALLSIQRNINIDTNGITFSPDSSGSNDYAFPLTQGLANQVLTTDGAGQLSWQNAGGGSGWSLTGNAGTTAGTNFIGTTDAQDFVVKTNGNEIGRFYSTVGPSSYSVALGGGVAPSVNMFVYGPSAGIGATSAQNSNFLGIDAGNGAINANDSNFFGQSAGEAATDAYHSNFFGWAAGANATNASNSNFFGYQAGNGATFAEYSNFLGYQAGQNATFAYYSSFMGQYAGFNATNANDSNFFGQSAGQNATNASYSNFIGIVAGRDAINAGGSNFIGNSAGDQATDAYSSNFIGYNTGAGAVNAFNSNFFGSGAGLGAQSASISNFFGVDAGQDATNASNSIFIGKSAGKSDTVNNTTNPDDFSILLGNNTSTGGFSNSIAIGGSAVNTVSNQFMIGSATRPIDTLVLTGSAGNTCVLDVTVASPSCSSDETLKTNIVDLNSDTLQKLIQVKTASYNWKNYPTKGNQIGFLAQDLEQYFPEVVSTAPNGFKTVSYGGMAPILVEAIREMNLNVTMISDMTRANTWRDSLIAWFGNVENGITKLFAHEVHTDTLCVGQTCVTESQLQQLLQGQNVAPVTIITTPPGPSNNIPGPDDTNVPTDNTDTTGNSDQGNQTENPIVTPETNTDTGLNTQAPSPDAPSAE